MSSFDFILNSAEFQAFSRPQGNVEKLLNSLPKMTHMEVTERMKTALQIDEAAYNPL